MDERLNALSVKTGMWLQQRCLRLATAESCTGGWIAEAVTAIPGSSAWFDCAFVTYSNDAKQTMLGVSADTLSHRGAVSEATVREMVAGALARSRADVALAVSGIAGPDGGTADKPVGTVWIAWGKRDGATSAKLFQFDNCGGDARERIRYQAVISALTGLTQVDE